tara:strand:+ start:535 stop:756 length:222 start_codon:yes stop_codon:yes gene_type:complete
MNCEDCTEWGSAFCKDCLKENAPANNAGGGGVNMNPTGKPRKKLVTTIDVTDRRYRKDKPPVLRRFKTFMKEK